MDYDLGFFINNAMDYKKQQGIRIRYPIDYWQKTTNIEVKRDMSMTTPAIHIRNLSKIYVVSEREVGVKAAIKSLIHRRTRDIHAVDGITFDLAPGEIVGFLGPTAPARPPRSRCFPDCSTPLRVRSACLAMCRGSATGNTSARLLW